MGVQFGDVVRRLDKGDCLLFLAGKWGREKAANESCFVKMFCDVRFRVGILGILYSTTSAEKRVALLKPVAHLEN